MTTSKKHRTRFSPLQQMRRRAPTSDLSAGVALVELAIVLPLIVGVVVGFLYLSQNAFLTAHAELAMLSAQFGFQEAPHRMSPNPVTLQPGLQRLNDAQIKTFIDRLREDVVSQLRNSGSFADPRANAVVELWYADIAPTTGLLAAQGNSAFQRASPEFYSGGDGTEADCFGSGSDLDMVRAREKFNDFVQSRLRILSSAETEGLFFGERIVDTRLVGGTPLFLASRSIVFVMTCGRRPVSILEDAPVLTPFVMLLDSEAAWDQ